MLAKLAYTVALFLLVKAYVFVEFVRYNIIPNAVVQHTPHGCFARLKHQSYKAQPVYCLPFFAKDHKPWPLDKDRARKESPSKTEKKP